MGRKKRTIIERGKERNVKEEKEKNRKGKRKEW